MKTLSRIALPFLALTPAIAAAQSFTIGTNGVVTQTAPANPTAPAASTTTTSGDAAFDLGTVQEFVVEEKADVRSERTLLQKRKEAETVSDSIGAQEIARTPDAGAQDSVKRITSATVQDGKYVLVRGLGGRYGQTLLNGVQLPSPEPDKQAVPLDLFPNALLSNLTVMKTYSADLPGNFAGGSLKIETSAYPTELESKVKVSTSGDTQSTFRDQRTYGGGSLDFLGMDDGSRSLPGSVPKNGPLLAGQNGMDEASVDAVGRDFDNQWSARNGTALPNLTLGATVGNTKVLGTNKLGWLATFNYGHKYGVQETDVARVHNEGGSTSYREKGRGAVGTRAASIGGLLNGGLQLGPDHEIGLLTLYTHAGESKTSVVRGYSESDAQNYEATRLEFVNRLLSFSQLSGKHVLRGAGALELDWQSNLSLTLRHEPDTRDTDYSVLDDGRMRFKAEPGSGERFFSDLTDLSGGAGVNATLPAETFARVAKVKVGASAQRSSREFDARRFRFDFIGNDPSVLFLPAEQLFAPERIGTDFRIEERTLQADAYDASLEVLAGYATAEVKNLDPVRVIAGVRYESATQKLTPGSSFAVAQNTEPGVDRQDADVLPALNVIWSVGEATNVRAGYSYTLARPQFRELAPFLYTDFARRRSISGNPALETTRIHNADLRWEWFLSGGELLSATVFGKRFEDPIEQVIASSTGDLSFANAAGADAYGAELEGRASLYRFHPALLPFRVAGNIALIESRIDLGDQAGVQTNGKRPLQGLSPLVVNLNAGWVHATGTELTLLYNVFGKRLTEVGFDSLPDVYEQPFHRVDLAVSHPFRNGLQMKLAATNLLDQTVEHKAGGLTVLRTKPGVGGALSLEWSR